MKKNRRNNSRPAAIATAKDTTKAIETRAGVVGVYKTKKKAEKVLDEIAEQIGCCKADKSFTRVEGSADSV